MRMQSDNTEFGRWKARNPLDYLAIQSDSSRQMLHDRFRDSSLANHKPSYIYRCISVIYALDSVYENFDV